MATGMRISLNELLRVLNKVVGTNLQPIYKEARAGDIVILAGKGHEPYQVLSDRTISFDDRAVARDILRSLGYKGGS